MRASKGLAIVFGLIGGTGAFLLYGEQVRSYLSPQLASAVAEPQTFHEKFEGAVKDLKIEELKVGTGSMAVAGKKLKIHYVGKLASDGKEFDSSVSRRDPLSFVLGKAEALPGLDRGVAGMRVGGKRRVTVPPFLGYGEKGVATLVPPNATLVFDVELLGIDGDRFGTTARQKSLKRTSRPHRHPNTRPTRFRAKRSGSAVSFLR